MGASGEENSPGGREAAAADAVGTSAELPGHDGIAAHEHPDQQASLQELPGLGCEPDQHQWQQQY